MKQVQGEGIKKKKKKKWTATHPKAEVQPKQSKGPT